MTIEEAKKALEQLKSEGKTDEEILGGMYLMFADGTMTLSDLRTLTELLGYEFTEEFEALSDEDKKRRGFESTDEPAEGVDKEDVEDAKEFGDDEGEKKEEDDSQPQSESEPKADEADDEEEDDEKKAARLFGFGGSNK